MQPLHLENSGSTTIPSSGNGLTGGTAASDIYSPSCSKLDIPQYSNNGFISTSYCFGGDSFLRGRLWDSHLGTKQFKSRDISGGPA